MFASLALLALLPAIVLAVQPDELTFAKIGAFPNIPGLPNATSQYDLTLTRGSPSLPDGPPGGLTPCTSPVYDACYQKDAADPYKRPFLALSDETLTVTWQRKARWAGQNFTTYQNKKPVSVQARLCYSTVAALDRGWRSKNKAYPRLSQNCPFKFESQPFQDDLSHVYTSTYHFHEADKMPTATLFVNIWVKCEDGTICAFDNTETKNFVQSEVYKSVTTPMIVAASILSIFSWAVFFGFFAFDNVYYKKHGKAYTLF